LGALYLLIFRSEGGGLGDELKGLALGRAMFRRRSIPSGRSGGRKFRQEIFTALILLV